MTKKPAHSETMQYLIDRYVGDDPERIAAYQRATADAQVAGQVYQLRTAAGLIRIPRSLCPEPPGATWFGTPNPCARPLALARVRSTEPRGTRKPIRGHELP